MECGAWTGFIWFGLGTGSGIVKSVIKRPGSLKYGEFLD